MRQGLKAFTLIELMVVIVIIGILLGILFTGWGYISEQQAIKKAKLEIVGLKNAVDEYLADYGKCPNCPNEICTSGETLFMSLAGFHNENGSLELPPYPSKIPTHLFHYDLSAFDESEIPDLSHEGVFPLKLWLAQTLGKIQRFLIHGETNMFMNFLWKMEDLAIGYFQWDRMAKPASNLARMI